MVDRVILIGESHYDLFKTERYSRAFEIYDPDSLSLEYCKGNEYSSSLNREYINSLTYLPDHNKTAYLDIMDSYLEASRVFSKRTGKCYFSNDVVTSKERAYFDKRLTTFDDGVWQEVFNQQTFYGFIISSIFSKEYLMSCYNGRMSAFKAFLTGISKIAISSEMNHLVSSQNKLDSFYFFDPAFTEEEYIDRITNLNCFDRDTFAMKRILGQSGTVVHCGGFGHFYGQYDNLFERLKREGIPVERAKLIDFHSEDPEETDRYKATVRNTIDDFIRANPNKAPSILYP